MGTLKDIEKIRDELKQANSAREDELIRLNNIVFYLKEISKKLSEISKKLSVKKKEVR